MSGFAGGAKIFFPSAIYKVVTKLDKVVSIDAYMYLEYKKLDTELYKYAMPNMLTENGICLGKTNTNFDEDINKTLENIIYAPYSHMYLNNVKGFADSIQYFEYLKENRIEERHLFKLNLRLKDIVEG